MTALVAIGLGLLALWVVELVVIWICFRVHYAKAEGESSSVENRP